MRNVPQKNLLIGNVKVFAGNKWADLPNCAKLRQMVDAQNIESSSCLYIRFFFIIFAKHSTQISVFMSR